MKMNTSQGYLHSKYKKVKNQPTLIALTSVVMWKIYVTCVEYLQRSADNNCNGNNGFIECSFISSLEEDCEPDDGDTLKRRRE
jgi:hypothetical protein